MESIRAKVITDGDKVSDQGDSQFFQANDRAMKYGKAIRICRAARGLSQKDLATKVGLDSSHISLIEAEKRSPSLETIERIAKSLNVPLHLLTLLASEQKDVKTGSLANIKELSQVFLDLLMEGDLSEKRKQRAR